VVVREAGKCVRTFSDIKNAQSECLRLRLGSSWPRDRSKYLRYCDYLGTFSPIGLALGALFP
jgi:hypothetical protein